MIINVARKELKSLFVSPMGWIILALLMLAFGSFYLQGVNNYFEVMSGSIRRLLIWAKPHLSFAASTALCT